MIGHYKRSKFLAEQVALEAAQDGLPVVIVNPSTPIGPGDVKPTPTGQIVLDAAAGRMPAYVDTGLNIVHVDDVAAGHLLAFHRGRTGERYILGGQDMTLREILAQIARFVDANPPRVRLPYAAVLPIAYVAEAMAKVTGRSGRVTLEGCAHVAQAHVFLERQSGARAGLPLASARRGIRRCRALVSRARLARLSRQAPRRGERPLAFHRLPHQQYRHADRDVARPLQQGYGKPELRADAEQRREHRVSGLLHAQRIGNENAALCAAHTRLSIAITDARSMRAPIRRKAIQVPIAPAIHPARCSAAERPTRARER